MKPDCHKYEGTVERVRALVTGSGEQRAAKDLRKYLKSYKGCLFDPKIDSSSDRISEADLDALRSLSVRVTKDAKHQLLGGHDGERVAELFSRIPPDLDIWDVSGDGYENQLGATSPAWQLWYVFRYLFRDAPKRFGRGVTAGKLLHGKRPRLVPIYDSRVRSALGPRRREFWVAIWCVMQQADIRVALSRTQQQVPAAEHLSLLRVLDIIAWMSEET